MAQLCKKPYGEASISNWDFDMRLIEVLIGIQDCRSGNPLIFSSMKIGNYSFRISLQPLEEGGDRLN